jgi:GNAT superfamily N-acetyltransferase
MRDTSDRGADLAAPGPAEDGDFTFDIRPAWRLADPQIERDAIAYWTRTGLLPPDVEPADRARELVAVAYSGDRIIGATTATVNHYGPLRARFAFLRGAVDPAFRRRQVGRTLLQFSRPLLEQWSAAHPEEKVLGLGSIVEGNEFAALRQFPVSPDGQLVLVGYLDDGRQIRVSWFAHARVE